MKVSVRISTMEEMVQVAPKMQTAWKRPLVSSNKKNQATILNMAVAKKRQTGIL